MSDESGSSDDMKDGVEIDDLREEHESGEHWELRREFLNTNWDNFSLDRLLCLSQTYCNIEVLGCRYPNETMQLVAELSKGIGHSHRQRQQNQIQRHCVNASAAAEQRIRGTRKPSQKHPAPTSEPAVPATSHPQAKVVYGPPVTSGPRVNYGPPVAARSKMEEGSSGALPRYGGVRTYNTGYQ